MEKPQSGGRIADQKKPKVVPIQIADAPSQKLRPSTSSITAYSVQCGKCLKWRLVSTQEEYEEIRKSFIEDPYVCSKRPGVSCNDPADIEYDDSRTWVIDKPNLPKTPSGFKRSLVVRSDYSKCDAYYYLPTGKKARALTDIEKFLEANPKYKSQVALSDFNFTVPKIMDDTVPRNGSFK